MLTREVREAVPRPQFEEHRFGAGQQMRHAIAEADGMAQVIGPIIGIKGLFVGQFQPRGVGDYRHLGRVQFNGL